MIQLSMKDIEDEKVGLSYFGPPPVDRNNEKSYSKLNRNWV